MHDNGAMNALHFVFVISCLMHKAIFPGERLLNVSCMPKMQIVPSLGSSDSQNFLCRSHISQSSNMDHPTTTTLDLTYGVEIECYLCRKETPGLSGEKKLKAIYQSLQHTLEAGGVPAYTEFDEHGGRFDRWLVTSDDSLKGPPSRNGYDFIDTEIVTRVLRHGRRSAAEVRCALNALLHKHLLMVDWRTGLHVHIGNGSAGIPFATAKNVAILAAAFEPALNSAIPQSRVDSSYCFPPSKVRHSYWRQASFTTYMQWLAQTHDVNSLIHVTSGGTIGDRNTQINFMPLKLSNKRTIEFRLFAGTLDAEEILTNVDLAAAIVCFAHETPERRLWTFIGKRMEMARTAAAMGVDCKMFDLRDLLDLVGARHLQPRLVAMAAKEG